MARQSNAYYDDGSELSPLDSSQHILAQIAANTGEAGGGGGATAANQATQIAAEQAIQAAVAKTATLVIVAAVASSTTTIPIGAFDVGILILTGTGTVAAVDWPVNVPLNIKGPLAATVAVVLANPGTACITYST